MDQEVAKTLGELELKLQELEHELTTIGHHEKPAEPLHAPGKLIDEAVERHSNSKDVDEGKQIDAEASPEEQVAGADDGFGGPPVFGGEEVPAQAGATTERDWTTEARETAYGEIPTPPWPPAPSSSPTPASPPLPPPQLQSSAPSSMSGASHPSSPPGPLPSSSPPGPLPSSSPSGPFPSSSPPGPPSSSPPPGITPPSASTMTSPPSNPPGMHPPSSPPGSHLPPPHRPDPRHSAAAEENQSIDLAELVRFRDKLASTLDGLIDEYSRLLSVDPPSRSRSD